MNRSARLCAALVLVAGCGGESGSISDQPEPTPMAVFSTMAGPSSVSAEPSGVNVAFTVETPDGWLYSGEFSVHGGYLELLKSVESSPPGKAQLLMNFGAPPLGDFRGNTPGREPPQQNAIVGVLFESDAVTSPSGGGLNGCELVEATDAFPSGAFCYEPSYWVSSLDGSVFTTTPASGRSSDLDEALVDAVVSDASNELPYVSISMPIARCMAWFDPAGRLVGSTGDCVFR